MAVRVASEKRDLRSKASVLALLRRAGVSERTVEAMDAALDDPVDLHRDAGLFFRYGVTVAQLVDRMGGSP
jgi:hypothetical protein